MATILWTIFLGCFAWQLSYWGLVLTRIFFASQSRCTTSEEKQEQPVSVVICARNEADNLKKNLPRILSQNHRCFEVIVVNDNSTDNTYNFLKYFKEKAHNFVPVNLAAHGEVEGKKAALKVGIAVAKYANIVLTDADCTPASSSWLHKMSACLDGETTIVLGLSPLITSSNMLGWLQQFETWLTYAQYCSWAWLGAPYMGVGRNLGYRKTLVDRPDLFATTAHLLSGDDDLTVNRFAKANNTKVVIDRAAFTFSPAPATWRAWWRQKRRHLSVSSYYRPWQVIVLGTTSASWGILHLSGILLLVTSFSWMVPFCFGLRWLSMAFIMRKWSRTTNEHIPIIRVPILDLGYAMYLFVMLPALALKPVKWN